MIVAIIFMESRSLKGRLVILGHVMLDILILEVELRSWRVQYLGEAKTSLHSSCRFRWLLYSAWTTDKPLLLLHLQTLCHVHHVSLIQCVLLKRIAICRSWPWYRGPMAVIVWNLCILMILVSTISLQRIINLPHIVCLELLIMEILSLLRATHTSKSMFIFG